MDKLTLKAIKSILDPALAFIAKAISVAAKAVTTGQDKAATKITDEIKGSSAAQTKALVQQLMQVAAALEDIGSPTIEGITVDQTQVVEQLEALNETIDALECGMKPEDFSGALEPLSRGLQMILNRLDEFSDQGVIASVERLAKALEAVTGASKKGDKTPVFKIDDQQFRELRNAGRGGGGPMQLSARSVTQSNVSVTATNTEYSYTFPANTLSWIIKLRDQGGLLYYAFASGTLPNSGTGAKYSTAPQGFIRAQENVEWGGKTIYFGSDTADMIAEIEAYTA